MVAYIRAFNFRQQVIWTALSKWIFDSCHRICSNDRAQFIVFVCTCFGVYFQLYLHINKYSVEVELQRWSCLPVDIVRSDAYLTTLPNLAVDECVDLFTQHFGHYLHYYYVIECFILFHCSIRELMNLKSKYIRSHTMTVIDIICMKTRKTE